MTRFPIITKQVCLTSRLCLITFFFTFIYSLETIVLSLLFPLLSGLSGGVGELKCVHVRYNKH